MERLDNMIKSLGVFSEDLADLEDIVELKHYKVTRAETRRIMELYDWIQDIEYRMTYLSHDITAEIEIPEHPTGAIPSVIELDANGISGTQCQDS